MNKLIKIIIENCHKYLNKKDSEYCKSLIFNSKKELIKEIKQLTNIKFYLTEKFNGKFVFICAIKKDDINELKNIIKENKLNLYCSSLSYNQLTYYKKLALNNKIKNISKKCGCYHCLMEFNSDELNYGELSNFEKHNNTFICPYCAESSVLFEKTNKDFLYEIELFVYGNKIDTKNYKKLNHYKIINLKSISID